MSWFGHQYFSSMTTPVNSKVTMSRFNGDQIENQSNSLFLGILSNPYLFSAWHGTFNTSKGSIP